MMTEVGMLFLVEEDGMCVPWVRDFLISHGALLRPMRAVWREEKFNNHASLAASYDP